MRSFYVCPNGFVHICNTLEIREDQTLIEFTPKSLAHGEQGLVPTQHLFADPYDAMAYADSLDDILTHKSEEKK